MLMGNSSGCGMNLYVNSDMPTAYEYTRERQSQQNMICNGDSDSTGMEWDVWHQAGAHLTG
jgi:hypothetical protein